MMLQMKFDYDWPAGLRDIYVWKCGRTDGRRLESDPISSSRALGSGELKMQWKIKMTYLQLSWLK